MKSYEQLEAEMVRYKDLMTVPIVENYEPVVRLDGRVLRNQYEPHRQDMIPVLGPRIIVRETVAEKLRRAQQALRSHDRNLVFLVEYGYRLLEIQQRRFGEESADIRMHNPGISEEDLCEATHRRVAVPEVAPHPTAGAVDLKIVNRKNGLPIEVGGTDYSTREHYVFAPDITEEARRNRDLLRGCMMEVGFAPFDGEHWHFSLGDREWAFYYKKYQAHYGQLSTKTVLDNLKHKRRLLINN